MKSIVFTLSNVMCIFVVQTAIVVATFEGWIDPDTPKDKYRLRSYYAQSVVRSDGNNRVENSNGDNDGDDDDQYELIMSDEFDRAGRSFKDGHDPMWTALDKSDDDQTSGGKKSLQFYNSSMVTTKDGCLEIKTSSEETKWHGFNPYKKKYETMKRHFKSGMVQGWNKFCFTGGILEVDVQFPGESDIGGLWPAVWLLGNLGRATYESSTNKVWPWSYPECNKDLQRAQELSGCDIMQHYSLNPGQGRGATEIDIIEVMAGSSKNKLPIVKNNLHTPYSSMTLQVAPGIPASEHRPPSMTLPEWGFHWYKNLTYGDNTSINPFFYGTYLGSTTAKEPVGRKKTEEYQCDAVSSMVQLTDSHFERMHKFRLEWQPGPDGYIHWYMDGKLRFGIEASSLAEQHVQIPEEPSYVIFNTAISTSWGFPQNPPFGCTAYDCNDPSAQCGFPTGFCKMLPATFKIDHVRIYQNKSDPRHTVGCNPKGYPTTRFIAAHEYRYKLQNDKKALKAVTAGGAKCSKNSNGNSKSKTSTNSECGEGKCWAGSCVCHSGWTGPNCLVPTYQNDFPDWDSDHWTSLALPRVPIVLTISVVAVVCIIAVAAVLEMSRKRESAVAVKLKSATGGGGGGGVGISNNSYTSKGRSSLSSTEHPYMSIDTE